MSERTITERENALRVLTRSAMPEWIPVSNDCLAVVFSSAVFERPAPGTPQGKDWFGCGWVWDPQALGYAPDPNAPLVLDDIANWREKVVFPDLDAIDWEAAAARDLADVDRDNKVIRFFMESGPLERANALLGFQGSFVAMATEPEEYKALIDAIADYKVSIIEHALPYYQPDEVFAQDDLGTAQGPMLSLDMYRELIKPAHIRISEAIRSHGAIHTHHSCGRMEAFIDDLLEVGVQVFNPIQFVNDQQAIADKYSDVASFDVGAEHLASFESSTEAEVRAEVRQVIDTFGPHGNLMVTLFPSNAATLEKIDIALDEARTYGGNFYN